MTQIDAEAFRVIGVFCGRLSGAGWFGIVSTWQAREYGGMNPSPNQAVQRTGASRFGQGEFARRGRLAPVADLGRSAKER